MLIISHSQSTKEKGFNANTETVTPNWRNETLVNLRTICGGIKSVDNADCNGTKELLGQCRGARSRYEKHLENKKKEKQETVNIRKRQMTLEEINEKKAKKAKLEKKIDTLEKEAIPYLPKLRNFVVLSEANTLRSTAKVVNEEFSEVVASLQNLEQELKTFAD